jgi:hypothetical protein
MAEYDDGGPAPTGVGYKLDVKVESLRTLSTELNDDLTDFKAEYDRWDVKGSVMHPLSAQYLPKDGAAFAEAGTVGKANIASYNDLIVKVVLLQKGVEALQKAADNLADTYKNLDDANSLSVSRVELMFPEPGKPGTPVASLPPVDKWVALPDGFDLNGDGVVREKDGDIPFAPSPTGKRPEFADTTSSKNSQPGDQDHTTRAGYTKPQDPNAINQKESGISEQAYQEYVDREAEKKAEEEERQRELEEGIRNGTVDIVAPGSTGTGNNGGSVVA